MQCDFWKRKLVISIPTNSTWRPWTPFCYRPVSAIFPVTAPCLLGPRQQFVSSHNKEPPDSEVNDANDAWSEQHYSLGLPLKRNTISLGWPRLQRLTQCPAQCSQSLGQMSARGCTGEPHCCLIRIPNVRNLSADELRVAIALRTVAEIFVSTECHRGKLLIR